MMNEISGLQTGLAGLALAGVGLVLAFLAGLRLLFLIRKPGKGRIARGIAVTGLVLILSGAVLLAIEELDVFRRATDRVASWLSGVAIVVALVAGLRAGRRRKPRVVEGEIEAPPAPAATAPEETQPSAPNEPAGS